MIRVHHLNNSRSQRVLWLLEELGLEYEIVKHQRNPETNLAPDSLKAVHPLGKSPVIEDGEHTVIESGAILEYLVRRHGKGKLAPAPSSPDSVRYLQWMHYAEGSAMLPLMLNLYLRRLGEAAKPLEPRVNSEIENHLGYLDSELGASDYFVGEQLTAADIQLSFVVQIAQRLYGLDKFPNLSRFIERAQQRPAYRKALARGGSYFGSEA
jgi:glutathione S-transferase